MSNSLNWSGLQVLNFRPELVQGFCGSGELPEVVLDLYTLVFFRQKASTSGNLPGPVFSVGDANGGCPCQIIVTITSEIE